VRLASSNDTLAPFDDETLSGLQSKHPPSPPDLEFPEQPDDSSEVLSVSCAVVARAIRSFKAGSAGGLDRLRPQHFKELISNSMGEAGVRFLKSLTSLVNYMLCGKFPPVFHPFLFGASLVTLQKPGGGLHPIAVGSVFRRLVAKTACLCLGNELGLFFRTVQLGFRTSGGCEAAVHAARQFLSSSSPSNPVIFLKVDYRNAFNSVRRDCFLWVVKEKFTCLFPFVWLAYRTSSHLFSETPLFHLLLECNKGTLRVQSSLV